MLPSTTSPPISTASGRRIEVHNDLNNKRVVPPSSSEFSARSTLALVGAFMALFCTLGFQNALGVFQEYYARVQLQGYSEFQIAWIPSLLTFLLFFCAAPAGVLTDRIGPTWPLIGGSIGTVLGLFMLSLCKEYYQFMLAQGVLVGVSATFLLTPAMTVVSHMFDRHRSMATGIMIAGSSCGGILWPIMLDQLLNERNISFSWSIRAVGFVILPLCVVIVLTVRNPPHSSQTGQVDKEESKKISASNQESRDENNKAAKIALVKNPTFLLLCGGLALATLGLFTPIFFIPSYAVAKGLSPNLAFYLVSMLNGASLFGRILTGILADKYGNFNLAFVTIAIAGIIAMCWTTAANTVGIIFFTLAYGYTSGAMFSLQSPCAVQLSTPATRGAAIGFLFVAPAMPGLIGPPVSGLLVKHGYIATSIYAGASLLAGSLLILLARLRQSKKLLVKV